LIGLIIAMMAVTTGVVMPSVAKNMQLAAGHLSKEQVIDRVFTTVERRILRRYYEARHGEAADSGDRHNKRSHKGKGKKHKGMPPGLAKRGGGLPPGLAKRGGKLPPGLAKRLPRDLRRDLPPRSPKYRRVVVDNDIVLIDAATNKVLDILEDVIRGR
jgi:hypothetical protein